MRSVLITFTTIIGIIFLSCKEKINRFDNLDNHDSISISTSIQNNNVVKNHRIIDIEQISVDTIIGNYRVIYKTIENGRVIITNPITEGKGLDTVYYACTDIILSLSKSDKNILHDKIINIDAFKSFIPSNEISKYDIYIVNIEGNQSSGITFIVNACIPDSDVCYWFKMAITDDGNIKIDEVPEDDSDM